MSLLLNTNGLLVAGEVRILLESNSTFLADEGFVLRHVDSDVRDQETASAVGV